MSNWRETASAYIQQHEGFKNHVYKCSEGYPTAGWGHKLTADELKRFPMGTEVPQDQILAWWNKDLGQYLAYADSLANQHGGAYTKPNVRTVMADMSFQMGEAGVNKFVKMHQAIRANDLATAAREMLDSKYAKQTPNRANENAALLMHG